MGPSLLLFVSHNQEKGKVRQIEGTKRVNSGRRSQNTREKLHTEGEHLSLISLSRIAESSFFFFDQMLEVYRSKRARQACDTSWIPVVHLDNNIQAKETNNPVGTDSHHV
jgi:hypothetical protein